jgi:hypothetical protein
VPRHRPTRAGGGDSTRVRQFDDGARDRALAAGPEQGSARMTS